MTSLPRALIYTNSHYVHGTKSMNKLLFVFTLIAPLALAAPPIDKRPFHLDEQAEKEIGYSKAVRIGDTLYVSGSVGQGDMREAIKQAYDSLGKALAAHGLDFSHVVKENVYATNLDAFIANKDARKAYYGAEYPAATWVQVERLYTPAFVVEVELIAAIPRE
jgi:enamine deaminase RidA (YjgF/YER057c/UK114 family)